MSTHTGTAPQGADGSRRRAPLRPGQRGQQSSVPDFEDLDCVPMPAASSAEIFEFLRSRPVLAPIVREACWQARRVFGSDTTLGLEVYADPEVPGARESLFLLVHTTLEAPEARALLDRFDEEWWIDALPAAQGLLGITLVFD